MSIKGKILPNHIPVNNYELQVIGLPALVLTEVGGISEELDVVDLPDRTKASGGNTQAVEFTITQPSHHNLEVEAMEAWFSEGKDPVSATYKKSGLIIKRNNAGDIVRTYTLTGMFVMSRGTADLSLEDEGSMDTIEWGMSADEVVFTT